MTGFGKSRWSPDQPMGEGRFGHSHLDACSLDCQSGDSRRRVEGNPRLTRSPIFPVARADEREIEQVLVSRLTLSPRSDVACVARAALGSDVPIFQNLPA